MVEFEIFPAAYIIGRSNVDSGKNFELTHLIRTKILCFVEI